MSNIGSSGSGQTLILAAGAVVSVVGALYVSGVLTPQSLPQTPVTTAEVVETAPKVEEAVVEAPDAATAEAAVLTPEVDVVVKEAAAAVYAVPTFDLVRIEADGSGQIAGSAEPGALVSILLDDTALSTVEAGADGNFYSFVFLEPSEATRVMTLSQEIDGQVILSDASVFVAPVEAVVVAAVENAEEAVDVVAEVATQDVTQTDQDVVASEAKAVETTSVETVVVEDAVTDSAEDATTEDVVTASVVNELAEGVEDAAEAVVAEVGEAVPASVEAVTEETTVKVAEAVTQNAEVAEEPVAAAVAPQAAAPVVVIADAEGARVLQAPTSPDTVEVSPSILSSVAVESVSYTDEGDVVVAGTSPSGDFVRVYVDNALSAEARISPDGLWKVGLDDVAPGSYTMRVDQVTDAGDVVSRIETPLSRETTAELVEAKPELADQKLLLVTVERGMTLWAISQERYGDGRLYLQVFEANKDQIRDPDLIYPGQVFSVPD